MPSLPTKLFNVNDLQIWTLIDPSLKTISFFKQRRKEMCLQEDFKNPEAKMLEGAC